MRNYFIEAISMLKYGNVAMHFDKNQKPTTSYSNSLLEQIWQMLSTANLQCRCTAHCPILSP